jgi:Helix-turn-helix domain
MARTVDGTAKRLFTVGEAAVYLAVSPKRIYNALRRGATAEERALFPVPAKKNGKMYFFERRDLDKYADALEYLER